MYQKKHIPELVDTIKKYVCIVNHYISSPTRKRATLRQLFSITGIVNILSSGIQQRNLTAQNKALDNLICLLNPNHGIIQVLIENATCDQLIHRLTTALHNQEPLTQKKTLTLLLVLVKHEPFRRFLALRHLHDGLYQQVLAQATPETVPVKCVGAFPEIELDVAVSAA